MAIRSRISSSILRVGASPSSGAVAGRRQIDYAVQPSPSYRMTSASQWTCPMRPPRSRRRRFVRTVRARMPAKWTRVAACSGATTRTIAFTPSASSAMGDNAADRHLHLIRGSPAIWTGSWPIPRTPSIVYPNNWKVRSYSSSTNCAPAYLCVAFKSTFIAIHHFYSGSRQAVSRLLLRKTWKTCPDYEDDFNQPTNRLAHTRIASRLLWPSLVWNWVNYLMGLPTNGERESVVHAKR